MPSKSQFILANSSKISATFKRQTFVRGLQCLACLATIAAIVVELVNSAPDQKTTQRELKFKVNPYNYSMNGSKYPCSTTLDNSRRVEFCAKPLMDLIEGKVERWPSSVSDIETLCGVYLESERCIRDVARRCMKGLHKTIVSTLATAVHRVRKQECTKTEFPVLLNLCKCSQYNQKIIHKTMANFSSHLELVDRVDKDAETKVAHVCCLTKDLENTMRVTLTPTCPNDTKTIIKLYRMILDDVINLVCRRDHAAECNKFFIQNKMNLHTPDFVQGNLIITRLLSIMFSLAE